MKPLSSKTLEKKYAELGLSKEKLSLLHDYYNCFANLYGVIMIREAWDIFRHYEGVGLVRKKDFVAFSGIVQREAGHLYSVLELKDVYSDETTDDPAFRLIVHNDLIGHGYGKYSLLYNTVEGQSDKPYYLPDDKREFLSFKEDQFYLSAFGKRMVQFLNKLKSNGKFKNYHGEIKGEILDINGNHVKGKHLSDFVFYTQDEQFDIDYHKSEAQKERLRQEYKTSALEKIMERIRLEIQTGGYFSSSPVETIQFLTEYMDRELGVELTLEQLKNFINLHTSLNNNSHLWLNCGWRPFDMSRQFGRGKPTSISIGPNMRTMFENGDLDRNEFERMMKKLGIDITD
ncbi:MAG: hypothetical protein K6F88_07720 [Ruminococcus sp.]|nr:hypothetical protein [Ruminococcus sp.]